MWFKVVLDKDGGVRSCDEVSDSFTESGSVVFVEADSKADAIAQAKERFRLRHRRAERHRREERLERGLCSKCGRTERRAGATKCEACAAKARYHGAERYARLATGGPPRLPHVNNLPHMKGIASGILSSGVPPVSGRRTPRLIALLDVRRMYEKVSLDEFRRWLDREIESERAHAFPEAAE